jgi:hypothetical protein
MLSGHVGITAAGNLKLHAEIESDKIIFLLNLRFDAEIPTV